MASRTSRRLAIASAVAILSAGLAGGVVAATTSSDEAALRPRGIGRPGHRAHGRRAAAAR